MSDPTVIDPDQLDRDGAPNLAEKGFRFLAEGDSWFTLGTLNPLKNANLLFALRFSQSHITVSCATPGDTLAKMVDWRRDPRFTGLLSGRVARHWDGLLLSAGGNDLIAAIKTPPVASGQAVPLDKRLMRTPAEWGPAGEGAARYTSDAGWLAFADYLRGNFDALIELRDRGPNPINAGIPIFMHGYAVPMPRNAGASVGPIKLGPWLLPGLQLYSVPQDDWLAVSTHFIGRLRTVLGSIAADAARYPNVHFFDSTQVALNQAQPGSTGESGDWINEIHLNKSGCRKVADAWAPRIEMVLR
jgi:hypothetical protein